MKRLREYCEQPEESFAKPQLFRNILPIIVEHLDISTWGSLRQCCKAFKKYLDEYPKAREIRLCFERGSKKFPEYTEALVSFYVRRFLQGPGRNRFSYKTCTFYNTFGLCSIHKSSGLIYSPKTYRHIWEIDIWRATTYNSELLYSEQYRFLEVSEMNAEDREHFKKLSRNYNNFLN